MRKKGQAAMEFLMTYGWAILVVLIAIGALAYFGVLNPSKFLPSSCTLAPGLSCDEFKVDAASDEATIVVRNGMGKTITVSDFSLAGTACTGITSIADGSTSTAICSVAAGAAGDAFRGVISMDYVASGETLNHSISGTLATKYE
ncbi:MAG: hypothetical protein ABIG93_04065 [archaeon]|nr:hypothetical protein [Nanoarchaeota archaeon]